MLNIVNAEVKSFSELDSTNSEALRWLNNNMNKCAPTWFIAQKQIKGRGRNQNVWTSDVGNLFTTLLIPIDWKIDIIPFLSCVAAVSVHEAINEFLGNKEILKIKWPNDIIYEDCKLSGILIENQISGDKKHSIIGIGVNINSSPENLKYNTTYLEKLTCNSNNLLENFFEKLKKRFHNNLNFYDVETIDYFREYALSNLWNLRKNIVFNYLDEKKDAILHGLGKNYEIELEINGQIKSFSSGEISISK